MQAPPPNSAQALFYAGCEQYAGGDVISAQASWQAALALTPDMAEAHANLAYLYEEQGDDARAEAGYRRALALAPALSQVQLNFGTFLAARKRIDEAEAAYTQAIMLAPGLPSGWSNLGGLYVGLGRDAEAELCCRQALLRDASHSAANVNLAYVLLRQGRYEEGWARMEARDWYAGLQARLACPRWDGAPLAGRRVLIGYEAGHGDVIQFARYAVELKQRGAGKISLLCHPALKRLFATLNGVDEVLAFDEDAPRDAWDCWTPLLSLPALCGTKLHTIPAALPYLRADAQRAAQWRTRLSAPGWPEPSLRVGLAWKGNPRFENDADRSLSSLAVLAPLAAAVGVQWVSLQKGAGEEEAAAAPAGWQVLNLGPEMADFADAAAIIANLDLVISVDTAMAHLAGALAKPCWLLLPAYKTDWRWLSERTDSPWYPGVMRLFRQRRAGDWAPALDEMRAALQAWASDAPGRNTGTL